MNGEYRTVLIADNLNKTFRQGENLIRAVQSASFKVYQGDFIAITGQSGSGKTTLLNILGCVIKPDSGSLWIGNAEVTNAADSLRAKIRRQKIGYIFQDYKLLPALTVRENIVLPLRLSSVKTDKAELQHIAEMLGIDRYLDAFPAQLSGGQQQRTAIARAIIHHPEILLADEPTGNLDSHSANELLKILHALYRSGISILMVTHNGSIAGLCRQQFYIQDGCLSEMQPRGGSTYQTGVI